MAAEDVDRLAVGALARTMIETKERLEGELAPQSKEQVRIVVAMCASKVEQCPLCTSYGFDKQCVYSKAIPVVSKAKCAC